MPRTVLGIRTRRKVKGARRKGMKQVEGREGATRT